MKIALSSTRSGRLGLLTKQLLRIMKLTGILLLVASLQISAKGLTQQVTFSGKQVSLKKIFSEVIRQTGVSIIYNEDLIKTTKPIDIDVKEADIEEVMTFCLKGMPFRFTIEGTVISVTPSTTGGLNAGLSENGFSPSLSPSLTAPPVTGIIRGPDGQSLAGVNIVIKGTKKGTTTNADGTFSIEAEKGDVIILSSIGYADRQITVGNNNTVGVISLSVSKLKLDEVQIIAYGQTTNRLSTGNISSVKAKDIEKAPVGNPLLAIAGRVPGVFIQQSTGVPGSGVKVIIQGQNSIGYGNDPFYVIDGVPYTSQLLPGLGGGILGESGPAVPGANPELNTSGNPLSFINPQDIESIDVLKDADATAIYGSRAANGAIIITTKKAKLGKMAVSVNMQRGFGSVAKRMKLLNTDQYLTMRREAYTNDNRAIPTPGIPIEEKHSGNYDLTAWDSKRNTDWQKELLGATADYLNIQSTITGGNSNTQYLISSGYQREGTVTPGNLRDRKISMHVNLSGNSDNKKFKFQFSGSYLDSDNKLAQVGGLVNIAYTLPPNVPTLYDDDGSLNYDYIAPDRNTFDNPLALLKRAYINKTTNLVTNMVLSYQLIPGLDIRSSIGYNRLQSDEVSASPLTGFAPHFRPFLIRTASFNAAEIASWIMEPQVVYTRNIWRGKLDALAGVTIQQENRDREQIDASGFSSDESMLNMKSAATIKVASAPNAVILAQYKYNAIFGRINYNIDNRYILNLSARRDGSSRFGRSSRFHNFKSIGAAWLFTNESFLKKITRILSFGKVRASYGTTGSDQIGDYSYLNLYQNTPTLGSNYQGAIGLEPVDYLPNPYLEWEETKKISATIDLGFFKDRLLIGATYYRNRCSNQLQFQGLSSVTGSSGIRTNKPATVQNTGIEVSLNTLNVQSKNFSWSSSINLTIPKNKLVSITGTSADLQEEFINRPLGISKVYHFIGVDSQTGLYVVADKDGKPTSTPDRSLDQIFYIDLNPKYYGGFQNTFTYKNFSLDLLFQFTNQIAENGLFGRNPGAGLANQPTSVLNRWQQPGDKADIQKYNSDFSAFSQWQAARESDKAFSSGSYIRLKNIAFSYGFPASLLRKAKLQNGKVFMNGQNLLTITDYVGLDPETRSTSGMPPLKVISFGVLLTF
jgi:TonB-dependent starch-binding outer membrane protein SusC